MQPELFLEPQRRQRFKARPQATSKLAALQLIGEERGWAIKLTRFWYSDFFRMEPKDNSFKWKIRADKTAADL